MSGAIRYPLETKAMAVARVENGPESARQVADDIGTNPTTVSAWRRSSDPELQRRAEEIGERIQAKNRALRETVIDTLNARFQAEAHTLSLKDVTIIYGILTDKDHQHSKAQAQAAEQGKQAGLEHMDKTQLLDRLSELKDSKKQEGPRSRGPSTSDDEPQEAEAVLRGSATSASSTQRD